MSSVKKLLMAAAGGAGGAGLDVDEVFSTYLYYPTTSTLTITNGIDLSGEGGLVWLKNRTYTSYHDLADTERGAGKRLASNVTSAEDSTSDLSAFNSNGFSLTSSNGNSMVNGTDVASWTFRKASKFFDVQTWTGNGSAGRTISHNLGSDPGMVIIKRLDSTSNWIVHHRNLTSTKYLALNLTNGEINGSDVTATSSTNITLSDSFTVNGSSATYVGYFFAHNDGDGDFGPDGDQDIIKCGSYTGNSSSFPSINLGFEPQWLMIKNATSGAAASDWILIDNMRGVSNDISYRRLKANETSTEDDGGAQINFTPTGFKFIDWSTALNESSNTYIYMAIRRGPLAEPTSASDVFSIDTSSGTSPTPPAYVANHLVDFAFFKDVNTTGNWQSSSRLTQERTIQLNSSNAQASSSVYQFDFMNGWVNNSFSNSNRYAWMWKRAPSYFDVVAYSGNGTAGRTVNHNLGVAPEMMWVKDRSSSNEWAVYHSGVDASAPEDYRLYLNSTAARVDSVNFWNDTAPTNSNFTVGNGSRVNSSGDTYIAYLFATLAGISKVGSFSHTNGGGDTNVDCGFSNGSKLVIVKNVDATAHWYLWDSARGIVSGNEDYLRINLSNAQVSADFIDPLSSGFTVTSSFGNVGLNNYIFYAIAA